MKWFMGTFFLFMLALSLGCGSKPEPPPLNEETNAAIAQEDASVDAEESQQ